jgi:uncharacterized LabA/DUF88 family protein
VSKNVAMFVDVANLYYAARGQDVDVDYVALLKHATKGRDLIRAYAYSGLDPENENQRKFLDFLNKNGYKVVHKDIRKFGDGRVKANLDIELVVDMLRLGDRMDIAVVVSGDGDFASAIRALQDRGVRCEVISFRPNTSSDLIAVADEFIDIMKVASIERGKASKMMGAPEMPAKEVNPEFGFREASRSVAAAALAALRTGDAPARPRGRGRATTASSASSAQEAPAVAAPAASNGSNGDAIAIDGDGSRRRRRRRGGRGRGRRTGEETVSTEIGGGEMGDPNSEVGWEEFDDISQLGVSAETDEAVLDETRADADTADEPIEIGFEEVDAATLAELGISSDEADGTAAAAGPPRPSARSSRGRTTRGRTSDTPTDGDESAAPRRARGSRAKATTSAADSGTEDKPKRATRSRTPKATADAAPEEKPKRATRARAPKAADAPAGDGGEGAPEGIWQRFRSGRTSS